jgi:ABC-type transport system involved in multi-copper enzyme maturation permease subunit
MRIWAIALITFQGLVRNKLILLFCAIFLCLLLLMMAPLVAMKSMAAAHPDNGAMAATALMFVGQIMSLMSGFGSLLAAWSAASVVSDEMKSGTILAVMARPVRRWEFLLGKYLGVQLLMAVYVVFLLAMSYALTWIGGAQIQSAPWLLAIYPMARYAVYSAIALLLVTMMHAVLAFAAVLVMCALIEANAYMPGWLGTPLHYVLPSTGLLSEERFFTLAAARLKEIPWTDHVTALAYAADCALVFFLLAAWSFRRRSLTRE